MPENEYEIVVDELIVNRLLNSDNSYTIRGMGINSKEELLNRKVLIDNMKDFTIVGISNLDNPSIYASKNLFVNILNNTEKSYSGLGIYLDEMKKDSVNTTKVLDYNLSLDDISITKGRLPINDYEVIVNESYQETMKLNKQINIKVNETPLTVVGYYKSKLDKHEYYVNNNTVKYDLITNKNGITIYSKEKIQVLNKLKDELNLNAIDCYERDKSKYLEDRKDTINNSIIYAVIILVISLIEIYLMMRASFLSRIKEVGVLRAIGVKKSDIYRMFLGEIIAITTYGSVPGIILMTYILGEISKIKYLNNIYIVNAETVLISVIIIFLVNILVGLLPLFKVLIKTPAQILSRHDI